MNYKNTSQTNRLQDADSDLEKITKTVKSRQRRLFSIAIIALAIALGSIFFQQYQDNQDKIAQDEVFQAIYHFEDGKFKEALEGDGVYCGLLTIIKKYPYTKTANISHLYAGICHIHIKQYDHAIQHLVKYSANDFLLQGRAWALLGDAYIAKEDYIVGAKYYIQAANYKGNEVFSPIYFMKAALAYEAKQDYKSAQHCYKQITEKYPKSMHYNNACKHVSRLSALLSQEIPFKK